MLKKEQYLDVIEKTTLTSVDLIIMKNNCILMGLRKNNPAKNYYFTPGVRTYKNENQLEAIKRVGKSELGIDINPENVKLVGVYDHIYDNNFDNNNFGTHYVVTAYLHKIKNNIKIELDDQHDEIKWINIDNMINDNTVHQYVKNYYKNLKKLI